MEYKKMEIGPYAIHLVKTDRFKEVTIKFVFKRKIKREEIIMRNFLSEILLESNAVYPTKRKYHKQREELYNIWLGSGSSFSGAYQLLSFTVSSLHEKYTEETMNEQSLQFLLDVIFKPNAQNGTFEESSFLLTKKRMLEEIAQRDEQASSYAGKRFYQYLPKGNPVSYDPYGTIEELEKLTAEEAYRYYESVLHSDLLDIYVVGDIEPSEIKKLITAKVPVKTLKKPGETHIVTWKKIRKNAKKVVEKAHFNQTRLMMGFFVKDMTDFERQYVSVFFNDIFGSSQFSKLFRIIREKHSYCYSIHSSMNLNCHYMRVESGIDSKNVNHVIRLVKKLLKEMTIGDFSEDDMQRVISNYISACEELLDSSSSIMRNAMSMEYVGSDPLHQRAINIKKVTKEMIVEFAKKISYDISYVLEGGTDHGED